MTLRERARLLEQWEAERAEAKRAHAEAAARLAELQEAQADKGEVDEARKRAAALKKDLDRIDFNKPLPPTALAVRDYDAPENAHINLGGNPHMLGDEVERGFLTIATSGKPPRIANRYSFDEDARGQGVGFMGEPARELPAAA